MFLKKIKNKLKLNYPYLANKLIYFRDTSLLLKFFNNLKKIDPNKQIHGKKIVNINDINFKKKIFISKTFRPIFSSDAYPDIKFENNTDDCAIILQGSITNYENFVIETIKIYSKIFPNSLIILSTWQDEINNNFLSKINHIKNLKILLNKKFKTAFNVNLQIISTSNGLEYAKKQNFKYSLKTRTDCRIYNPYALNFLKLLLKTFEVKNSNFFKNRILSGSIDTRIFRVYGLSDICMFGDTNDLGKYFLNENYEESLLKMGINVKSPIINDVAVINEIFLCARYLFNTNQNLDWSLEDWWDKCKNLFCIFDSKSIDFFWYKYHWQYEQRFLNNYTSKYNQSLQFYDWINIYNNNTKLYDQTNKEEWHLVNGFFEQKN